MPWTKKQMLRDANGDLIPQYWDITAGEFKPLTGQDGAQDTRLTGSIEVEEYRNINIDADSNYVVESSLDVSEFKYYTVGVVTGEQHKYEVQKRDDYEGHALDSRHRTILEADYNASSDRQLILTPTLRIRIVNKEDDALTVLRFFVFLFK